MQTIEISEATADAFERNLARSLQRQIDEWKTRRSPVRTHAASGVLVERRVDARRRLGHPRVERA
jgi:hypothetical protein